MCVWITVESVFQCLGTDTSCPTRALSLIPENILGGIPEMIQEHFQEMFLFFSCHEMREYSACLCFVLWLCGLDSLKCSVVIFNRSDMARIPVTGLNGILCRARKRRRVHVICFTWDTYTQTSVADCCISRLKVVFSWQRAAFQLRATKDIRSQLGNKLSSAYFLVYLHFAVCGLTV